MVPYDMKAFLVLCISLELILKAGRGVSIARKRELIFRLPSVNGRALEPLGYPRLTQLLLLMQ